MTNGVQVHVTLKRARFWEGEPITLGIRVATDPGAAAVDVPLPFSPADSDVRVFVARDDGDPVAIGPASPRTGSRVTVPSGDLLLTELAVHEWVQLEPGAYALDVVWSGYGAQTVEFEVVPVERMTLTMVGHAPTLRAVGTVSGPGFGALVEQQYRTGYDDETVYERDSAMTTFVADAPLRAAVPAGAWIAGVDAGGLVARANPEVAGMARHAWPDGAATVVPPASPTDGSGLRVLTLGADGALHALDFDPPCTETEAPTGPDDWDDEILVPGPVRCVALGRLPGAASAVRDGDRVVGVAGRRLVFATLRGDELVDPGGVDLPGEALSVAAVQDGTAAVVVRSEERGIGFVVTPLSGDTAATEQWLGVPPHPPTEAAAAFAPGADGTLLAVCAIRCGDAGLYLGDITGRVLPVAVPAGLLSPLVVTAAAGAFHVAVAAKDGPTLLRVE